MRFKIALLTLILAVLCLTAVSCGDETAPDSFTVSFDSDGGTAVEPITVLDGGTAEAPTPPTKEGYDFVGWYNSDVAYTFGTPIRKSFTLKAKWQAKEFNISFSPENGEKSFTLVAVYGETFTVPVPKREGYNFLGWYSGDAPYDFGSVKEDASVTARWLASSGGLEFTEGEDKNSYTVTGIGTFTGDDLIIPSHHNGKTVTAIGAEAFSGTGIKSLHVPGTVKKIDFMAFADCTSLTTLIIDDGVNDISSAFYGCTALTEVTLADSITRLDNAFRGCTSLEKITLPKSTVSANNAFGDCPRLITNESDGGIYLGTSDNPYYMLLSVKDKSIASFNINTGTVIIHTAALKDCKELTELSIPGTVRYIYGSAFMGCEKLTTMIVPSSVSVIASYAFAQCYALKTAYIPYSITELGYHAFDKCDEVTVYCAVSKAPEGWDLDWSMSFLDNDTTVEVKVVWGSAAIG